MHDCVFIVMDDCVFVMNDSVFVMYAIVFSLNANMIKKVILKR